MKESYDKTANYIPFEINQKVWLFTPTRIKGQSPKLQDQWSGPYQIISILNDCVVRIQSLEKPAKFKIVKSTDWLHTTVHKQSHSNLQLQSPSMKGSHKDYDLPFSVEFPWFGV